MRMGGVVEVSLRSFLTDKMIEQANEQEGRVRKPQQTNKNNEQTLKETFFI